MVRSLSIGTVLFHSALAVGLAGGLLLGDTLFRIWYSLPDVTDPQAFQPSQSLVITDRYGQELYRFYHDQDRTVLTYEEIPPHMIQALVAIEDKRFFERSCIDLRALLRAALANISDYKSQGASTISQQLARTVFLTREKTLERKVREIMLACAIEHHYSKEEIVELYLNWISFGHGIAGLKQAAARYFGVDVTNLSVAQSATLAALPQRPTYFSPYGPRRRTTVTPTLQQQIRSRELLDPTDINPEHITLGLLGTDVRIGDDMYRLLGRADYVLDAMLDQRYLSHVQWQQAKMELAKLNFTPRHQAIDAPHFVISLHEEIKQLAARSPDLSEYDGLQIHSTIEPRLQKLAEDVLAESIVWLRDTYQAHNAALLAIDPRSNEILAYVGSPDFFDELHGGQIDMARLPRQTGSSFKPIVYAALLEQGFTDKSFIYDSPLDPATYRPARSGYYGRMTIRTALARSRNIPAIRAFYGAGGEDIILHVAEAMGVSTPKWYLDLMREARQRFTYSWTLALGAAEASLLEMMQAYSVFPQGGMNVPITGIRTIADHQGESLFSPSRRAQAVLKKETTDQITSILRDEDARESLWRHSMQLPFGPAALKTGTSTLCTERDHYRSCTQYFPNNTWTIGYTDDMLVGVWVGNVDNQPLNEEGTALMTSLPVWREFLTRAHTLLSAS